MYTAPLRGHAVHVVTHVDDPIDDTSQRYYLQLSPLHLPLRSLHLEAGPLMLQEVQDARDAVLGPACRPCAAASSCTASRRITSPGLKSFAGSRGPRTGGGQQRIVIVVEENAGPRLLVHGRPRSRGRGYYRAAATDPYREEWRGRGGTGAHTGGNAATPQWSRSVT